jgi:hypothetical protein
MPFYRRFSANPGTGLDCSRGCTVLQGTGSRGRIGAELTSRPVDDTKAPVPFARDAEIGLPAHSSRSSPAEFPHCIATGDAGRRTPRIAVHCTFWGPFVTVVRGQLSAASCQGPFTSDAAKAATSRCSSPSPLGEKVPQDVGDEGATHSRRESGSAGSDGGHIRAIRAILFLLTHTCHTCHRRNGSAC